MPIRMIPTIPGSKKPLLTASEIGTSCFSAFRGSLLSFRVPRTKQEIEGDYKRKKLAEKFQERLRLIQKQDMDILDLQQALKLIQEDFDQENAKIQEKVNLDLQQFATN
ncbi:uncharacterized protein LOC123003618 isoform X2 [Tribolium madens]|uniref:uncharacterized protein LOC123003618 isoform X2 n=1 Tax=Tribolium madens TaxID=41895 RepID=UPI001CF72C25|nr:uncharacterized protein LOC123003618 isoform X2 [Tribolium madens]